MDAASVAAHLQEAKEHWYFVGRLAVLRAVVGAVRPPGHLRILELGCGSGNVLEEFAGLGEAVGMEVHPDLIAAARAGGLDVRQGSLPGDLVVPDGWADMVLMLDVVEHVDDDAGALRTARRALRPGGVLLVTVPAFAWLWSGHDVAVGHRRRYVAPALRALVAQAGFRVEHVSYFNTLLFPGAVLMRAWKRWRGDTSHDMHRPPAPINRVLAATFGLERLLVPRWRLPFGVSILLVGRR
jgi:SAM-dependent methyltransferase